MTLNESKPGFQGHGTL